MRRSQREREFSEFFATSAPGLRRTAYLVVHDWHLAEDLTQQAMTKLYAAWPRARAETRTAYARKIVLNECLSHLRRHRPETPTAEVPDVATCSVPDGVPDVAVALASLPPRQRAIIALRFLDDQSVQQVADALGIAEGTVKSQTSRALDTLRRHLGSALPALETR